MGMGTVWRRFNKLLVTHVTLVLMIILLKLTGRELANIKNAPVLT